MITGRRHFPPSTDAETNVLPAVVKLAATQPAQITESEAGPDDAVDDMLLAGACPRPNASRTTGTALRVGHLVADGISRDTNGADHTVVRRSVWRRVGGSPAAEHRLCGR